MTQDGHVGNLNVRYIIGGPVRDEEFETTPVEQDILNLF